MTRDQLAVFILRDGVDGEVAPLQVLFERDGRVGVEFEAVIAARGFALGARQRVFLVRLRMQEHRKIATDGFVAELRHRLRCGTDDHIVPIDHGNAHQLIAHRTTNVKGRKGGSAMTVGAVNALASDKE